MLKASDNVVQNAYKRMDMSNAQSWATNTENEVDFIIRETGITPNDLLVDFGCGQGRHCLELARRGICAVGIDYVDKSIDIANRKKIEQELENVRFVLDDCRSVTIETKAAAAICLYDVVDTYADNNENLRILKNISDSLIDNGIALISVMNYELTLAQAKNRFVLSENPNALLTLRPSDIMEATGNVFNPDFYLVDTESGVVYRREQFKRGRTLPVELIVRDKRFSKEEIEKMFNQVGLVVEYSRFVNARDWDTGFCAVDKSAKEILLKCRKEPCLQNPN